MLKPDAVQRGMTGKIIAKFELKGFKLCAMKLCQPGKAHMEAHYADLASKKFFPSLVEYMISGPVCAMVWEGDDAVATGRVMLGATRPADSAPGTLRGNNCIDVGRNIIHGSDAVEAANAEIALWFSPSEVLSWTNHSAEWLYEMPEPKPVATKPVYAESAQNAALDARLANCMYLGGNQPSQEDAKVSAAIKAGEQDMPTLKYSNAFAWYCMASKFQPARTAAFAAGAAAVEEAEDDLDEDDLFAEDSDEAAAAEAKDLAASLRGKAFEAKKKAAAEAAGKAPLEAKSLIIYEVKPVDDETDLQVLGKRILSEIVQDGLFWKTEFKTAPIAYGIEKLIIGATIIDAKVSTDDVQEKIEEMDDMVQSVDIQSFNKL